MLSRELLLLTPSSILKFIRPVDLEETLLGYPTELERSTIGPLDIVQSHLFTTVTIIVIRNQIKHKLLLIPNSARLISIEPKINLVFDIIDFNCFPNVVRWSRPFMVK